MAIEAYEDESGRLLANRYETVNPEELFSPVMDLLPSQPAAILDVGAGSGRDAAWFAELGYSVLAVEPAATMRSFGVERHKGSQFEWLDDSLPGLKEVYRIGTAFDAIFVSAVWMHVPPNARERAFRKLAGLLKPGGKLFISLRMGQVDQSRSMYPVSSEEIISLAQDNGMSIVYQQSRPDVWGRAELLWEQLVLQLHDDGTDALPILRHVVLNDAKSSTYKLGLLRSVARAADGSQGMAEHGSDGEVYIPLGLVALNWLRLYHPLINSDLPQNPVNRGAKHLGFIKNKTWNVVSELAPADFRVGSRFTGDRAKAIHYALREAATTITRMPAHHITYPGTDMPIFPVTRGRAKGTTYQLIIDEPYLSSFGKMRIPGNIWRTMVRFDAWIEPALVAEWIRLMQSYAQKQGREIDQAAIYNAMQWLDPSRDVSFVRDQTIQLMQSKPVYCVWSGTRLRETGFHVDHCLPWAAWPCADLWNLLPSHPKFNSRKSDKLPSAEMLDRSSDRILEWWNRAWTQNETVEKRFLMEAKASLPLFSEDIDHQTIFDGLQKRRFAIRSDHQISEWSL